MRIIQNPKLISLDYVLLIQAAHKRHVHVLSFRACQIRGREGVTADWDPLSEDVHTYTKGTHKRNETL